MILPIGHQEASVRRLPWVTFALMAACLVVFLFTDTEALESAASPASRMQQAADYWRSHAYLEADPRIREQVAYDVMPNQRSQYLATLPDLCEALRPHDPEGLAAQQAQLDRLSDLALGLAEPEGVEQNAFQRWGFVPDAPRAIALLTHLFLHAGWFHLAGNLFMLLLAGPPIEDRWGRAAFAGFYALAGACAALVHMLAVPESSAPLVGASGAIAGVLGAFLVRLWKTRIRFAYFFFFGLRLFTGTFEAAAWLMLPLWFGNELLQGVLWKSIGLHSGVAYWAHVGGFLFGVAVALAVRASKFEERFVAPAIDAQVTHFSANPVLEQAMEARERGQVDEALALLEAEWRRQPDEDVGLALWDAALACARPVAGAPGLRGAVRSAAKRGDLQVALRHWSELSDQVPGVLVEPATLLRFVPLLLAENQRDRAVLALRQAVDPNNTALSPGQAMRVLEAAREIDPPSALRAARCALAAGEMHEAKRAKLEALVAELEAQGAGEVAPEPEPAPAEEPPLAWSDDGAIPLARFARAKLTEARPVGLEPGVIRLALEGERQAGLRLERIQAVAVAAVEGQGPKPILVIDLIANWNEPEADELRGVRLRSDRFDPRRLLGVEGDPRQALISFVGRLLEASHGVPLPGAEAALGRPFARYASLRDYERQVLELAAE